MELETASDRGRLIPYMQNGKNNRNFLKFVMLGHYPAGI